MAYKYDSRTDPLSAPSVFPLLAQSVAVSVGILSPSIPHYDGICPDPLIIIIGDPEYRIFQWQGLLSL
jgi:hypothetical protein